MDEKLVNGLFNVTPNEEVIVTLKNEIVIPEAAIEKLPKILKGFFEKIGRKGE